MSSLNMVRFVRYASLEQSPIIVVAKEDDLVVPIQEAFEAIQRLEVDTLVILDVFPIYDTKVETKPVFIVTDLGDCVRKRTEEREEYERNMALLYFWDAMQLPKVADNGILTASLRSPLSVAETEMVLKQLAHHTNYRHQTVISITKDLKIVSMKDGKVTVEDNVDKEI